MSGPQSHLNHFIDEGIDIFKKGGVSKAEAARQIIAKYGLAVDDVNFSRYIQKRMKRQASEDHGIEAVCEEQGIDIENVNHYWYKGKHHSIHVKNPTPTYEQIKDDIVAEMREHAPIYPVIIRHKIDDGHLLVIDPADIHIGKLCSAFENGEAYNNQIAVNRVKEGVQGILNKAQGWNIDKILYIVGNDKLHIDTPKRTTTSGTPQDTDGMWYDNFLIAKQLDIEIIELLRCIAPVHVQYDPSNHDYTNGFFLADTIKSWFSKCDDVTFNVSIAHRKYFVYGENLIGSTHGDGAKAQDLPLLMAQEAAKDWAGCKHRYFYTHHMHHKISKDYGSVCVETLRSPSGTDSWHHRNGYQWAPKAIEAFIHNPIHGQVCRITHLF
jgi:hypothetical protein